MWLFKIQVLMFVIRNWQILTQKYSICENLDKSWQSDKFTANSKTAPVNSMKSWISTSRSDAVITSREFIYYLAFQINSLHGGVQHDCWSAFCQVLVALSSLMGANARKYFPSVLWQWWLGNRKGSGLQKAGCWYMLVTIWLELCTSSSSTCHRHLRHP